MTKKEIINISYRKEKINGILYYPDEKKESYPLIIRTNGMPGFAPSGEEKRFAPLFTQRGFAYYTFDYVGVRESTGIFDYLTAQENINYVINVLANHPIVDASNIMLFGESFGAAMAICHTTRDPRIKCLVARSPVADTRLIASLPFFDDLCKIWTRNNQMRFPNGNLKKVFAEQTIVYNPIEEIKKLNTPFLLIGGKYDELLPVQSFKTLYNDAFSSPLKRLCMIEGDHNFTNQTHFIKMAEEVINFFQQQLVAEVLFTFN